MSDVELRELNKQIAEQVFGVKKIFRPCDVKSANDLLCGTSEDYHFIPSGKPPRTHMIDARRIPDFASSIAAAMEVVEKMRGQGWSFACTLYEGKLPYASFCKRTAASSRNAEAESLSEAICTAALKAVVETERVNDDPSDRSS